MMGGARGGWLARGDIFGADGTLGSAAEVNVVGASATTSFWAGNGVIRMVDLTLPRRKTEKRPEESGIETAGNASGLRTVMRERVARRRLQLTFVGRGKASAGIS